MPYLHCSITMKLNVFTFPLQQLQEAIGELVLPHSLITNKKNRILKDEVLFGGDIRIRP